MKIFNDKKGFTLVELLATIVILSLLIGIGAYSITAIIKSSKEETMKLLIRDIMDGAESYYNECRYNKTDILNSICSSNVITLSDLVTYGFVTGNGKDSNGNMILVNPDNDKSIGDCEISVSYSEGNVIVKNESKDKVKCLDYDGE